MFYFLATPLNFHPYKMEGSSCLAIQLIVLICTLVSTMTRLITRVQRSLRLNAVLDCNNLEFSVCDLCKLFLQFVRL